MAEARDSFDPIAEAIDQILERHEPDLIRAAEERVGEAYPPASKPGEPPRKRTGRLQRSFRVQRTRVGDAEFRVEMVNDAPYAGFLEASGRPVVGDAPDEVARRIDAEIERIP